MTANQIAYQRHLEDKRHNTVTETETHRSNIANEFETNRHNVATEQHNTAVLGENIRHNVAVEGIQSSQVGLGYAQLAETAQHNRFSETAEYNKQLEAHRHNSVTEAIDQVQLLANHQIQTDKNLQGWFTSIGSVTNSFIPKGTGSTPSTKQTNKGGTKNGSKKK